MEKYGTIPKRFTKEWWEYFWEYYKWHVFGGALVISMITITLVQLLFKTDYDVTVTYIGNVAYSDTSIEKIESAFEETIPDINENGKEDVQFQVLSIARSSSGIENPQYTMAMETKKILEMQTGEAFLFILDKEQMQSIVEHELAESTFLPADTWAVNSEPEYSYFVKIPSNEFFEEREFETGQLYMGIRKIREKENENTAQKKLDASIEIANCLK